MAGVDKICQVTGEYIGSDMHAFSRDFLQIAPASRSLFRGKWHTLYIFCPIPYMKSYYRNGYCSYSPLSSYFAMYKQELEGKTLKQKIDFVRQKEGDFHLALNYGFALDVPDVPGVVEGMYFGNTFDLANMKRRIKRLLRCRKLKVSENSLAILEDLQSESNPLI